MSTLRWLSLQGFKAYGHKQQATLRIAPLTLLYGENSAGKSSLLHALMFLRQTLEAHPWGVQPVYRGEHINLGEFAVVVHRNPHDRPSESSFRLGIGFGKGASLQLRYGPGGLEGWRLKASRSAPTESVAVSADKALEPAGEGLEQLDLVPVPGRPRLLCLPEPEKLADWAGAQGEKQLRWLAALRIDPWERAIEFEAGAVTPDAGQDEQGRKPAPDEFEERLRFKVETELLPWVHRGTEALAAELSQVVAIAPHRSEPMETDLSHFSTVLLDGEMRERVNELLDELEVAYHVDLAETEHPVTEIRMEIPVLRSTLADVRVRVSDVGYGVRQILPVVIRLVEMDSAQLMAIQQPELHLHPKLQGNVLELMVDALSEDLGESRRFLVETHSENVFLRLQKLLREEHLKESPRVSNEMVSVHYVHGKQGDGEGGARLVSLELDEKGNLRDAWPGGFFEERLEELT